DATAPDHAAEFPLRSASMAGVGTETEVVRPTPLPVRLTGLVPHADPAWVLREVLRLALVFQVVEVKGQGIARLHRIHQAETVEGGALVLVPLGDGHGERLAFELLRRGAVAAYGELHLPIAIVGQWVVIELPGVARAVILQRWGADFLALLGDLPF